MQDEKTSPNCPSSAPPRNGIVYLVLEGRRNVADLPLCPIAPLECQPPVEAASPGDGVAALIAFLLPEIALLPKETELSPGKCVASNKSDTRPLSATAACCAAITVTAPITRELSAPPSRLKPSERPRRASRLRLVHGARCSSVCFCSSVSGGSERNSSGSEQT